MDHPSFVDIDKRYSIVRELGRGGMGVVYEAIDLQSRDQRHVALKTGIADERRMEKMRDAISREYAILSRIDNQHIVRVFEIGEASDHLLYYTMELVQGIPLSELIQNRKAGEWFRLTEIIYLLTQIADALEAIHSEGYVYADLKPSNVLISQVAGEQSIKLIDFGTACPAVTLEDSLDEDAIYAGLGRTPNYMSPEQTLQKPLSIRSDIYTFGMLAYELCTKAIPYEADNMFEIRQSHMFGEVESVRIENREVPRLLDLLIRVCLEKVPLDRFADMARVKTMLTQSSKKNPLISFLQSIFQRRSQSPAASDAFS